jgi:hypothetical protein
MKNCILLILGCTFFTLVSCKKYLDLKPDASIAVPETMEDIRGLLNDVSNLNVFASSLLEMAPTTITSMIIRLEIWMKPIRNVPMEEELSCYWSIRRLVQRLSGSDDGKCSLRGARSNKNGCRIRDEDNVGEALFNRALVHYCEVQVYTEIGQLGQMQNREYQFASPQITV